MHKCKCKRQINPNKEILEIVKSYARFYTPNKTQ